MLTALVLVGVFLALSLWANYLLWKDRVHLSAWRDQLLERVRSMGGYNSTGISALEKHVEELNVQIDVQQKIMDGMATRSTQGDFVIYEEP